MRIRTFAFAATLCLLTHAAWPANEIMANFVDLPIKTANGAAPSADEARDTIINAASSVPRIPWTATPAGPDKLVARMQTGRRPNVVIVEIAYSPQRYTVTYRNSQHMNYRPSDQTIHPSYNVWVRQLVAQIDLAFGTLNPVGGAASSATQSTSQSSGTPLAVAPPSAAASSAAPGGPLAGDSWTYKVTYIRRRGEAPVERPIRTHVVTVESASETEIVDRMAVDGGTPIVTRHVAGVHLVPQGVSVLSPYIGVWADLSQPVSLGSADIHDPGCSATHICSASARVAGAENIRVPAGTFATTRIVVTQSWRGSGSGSPYLLPQMSGGRTLTLWYSPQVKRVVKASSRVTVGDIPPIDAHFDLELTSHQVK